MSFKLNITQIKADGTRTKIELDNSKPLTDQAAMLEFLRPLLYEPEPLRLSDFSFDFEDEPAEEPKEMEPEPEEPKPEPQVEPERKPIINRTKTEPVEKAVVRQYSDRETGIAQIHCPKCGLETAKHVPVKSSYIHCPTCKVKLFLYPLSDVRGEPNRLGVSFKANNVFLSAQEKWEMRNGKS